MVFGNTAKKFMQPAVRQSRCPTAWEQIQLQLHAKTQLRHNRRMSDCFSLVKPLVDIAEVHICFELNMVNTLCLVCQGAKLDAACGHHSAVTGTSLKLSYDSRAPPHVRVSGHESVLRSASK